MGLTTKQQRSLFESINQSINGRQTQGNLNESYMPESAETVEESLVMDYLQNSLQFSINESTGTYEIEHQIVEAVRNLNTLCDIVNEYFGYN